MTTPYSDPWEKNTGRLTPDSFNHPNQPPPPPLVKDVLDQELAAMRTIDVVLSRLDSAARGRVLAWAYSKPHTMRQVSASATVTDSDTPWHTHTVDDIPPLTRAETEGPDYEWPTVSVYLNQPNPIRDSEGDEYTVADARRFAAYLLSAAHRVDTHAATT
jgi:hypothetical protein